MTGGQSKAKLILTALAATGLAALLAGVILQQGGSINRVLVMIGVSAIVVAAAGLGLRRIFADGFLADVGSTDDAPPFGEAAAIGMQPADSSGLRRLTDAQRRSLVSELTGANGKVMIWASEIERAYARDFAECFTAASWQVKITYRLGSMGEAGYRVHRLAPHQEAAQRIISAMWVAGFAIDIVEGRASASGLDDFTAGMSLGRAV